MEILFIDRGIVKITEEGMALPSFRVLFDEDKKAGKPVFKKRVEMLWYLYSKESPYFDMKVVERYDVYSSRIMGCSVEDLKKILEHRSVKDCVKEYEEIIMTREDKQLTMILDDIDNYIEDLSNVPSKRKIKTKFEVEHPDSGDKTIKEVIIDVMNTDEKLSVQKAIQEAYKLVDYIEDRRKKKGVVKQRRYLRIFDNPEG